jgi:hypothetical protein
LAKELKRQGHEVAGYSQLLGHIARELEKEGIKCFNEPTDDYDLIIASHYPVVEYLRHKYPTTPIISTIHGIMHEMNGTRGLESPATGYADRFVAVSEEVQKKLKDDYNIDSTIIRNAFEINCQPVNDKPKRVLFNSNYNKAGDEVFTTVLALAQHYGAKLLCIGHNFIEIPNVREEILRSDIVIGIGRSVLEGVALGRLGIVHGRWGTGGVIHEDNVKDLQYYNFSGRNSQGTLLDVKELIEQVDKYYNKQNEWATKYMLENHNIEKTARDYLKLYEDIRSDKNKE